MPFYTYILRCANDTYYTGHTDDLDRRMAQHSAGEASAYTARHRPVELVWSASFDRREYAFELERRLKGWGQAKKDALIRGEFDALPALARGRGRGGGDRVATGSEQAQTSTGSA